MYLVNRSKVSCNSPFLSLMIEDGLELSDLSFLKFLKASWGLLFARCGSPSKAIESAHTCLSWRRTLILALFSGRYVIKSPFSLASRRRSISWNMSLEIHVFRVGDRVGGMTSWATLCRLSWNCCHLSSIPPVSIISPSPGSLGQCIWIESFYIITGRLPFGFNMDFDSCYYWSVIGWKLKALVDFAIH